MKERLNTGVWGSTRSNTREKGTLDVSEKKRRSQKKGHTSESRVRTGKKARRGEVAAYKKETAMNSEPKTNPERTWRNQKTSEKEHKGKGNTGQACLRVSIWRGS